MTNVTFPPKRRKLPAWMYGEVCEEEKPTLKFSGRIKYCVTFDEVKSACEDLIQIADGKDELVLGFDVEWPVSEFGSGKIALVQICVDETLCFLFHVGFVQRLPESFVKLIKHSRVKLTGCCIKNDMWKLGRDFDIPVSKLIASGQVIEIQQVANEALRCAQVWSLERLALHVLSVKLDKTRSLRMSRWDHALSDLQKVYAATDAYVSLLIYEKLKLKCHSQ